MDLSLPCCSSAMAISRLAAMLEGDEAVGSLPDFEREVLEREKLSPTVLSHGVALPHARTEHIRDIVLLAGRSRDGIKFGDAPPVHLIFLIGTPNDRVAEYLALVGSLTRSLKDAGVRENLLAAETPEKFIHALS